MTSTTTVQMLRYNIPRGEPYKKVISAWTTGATPIAKPIVPTGTKMFIKTLDVSFSPTFYTNAATNITSGDGALLISFPCIRSGESGNILTLTFTSIRQLIAAFKDGLQGDSTNGYYGKIEFDPPLQLSVSITELLTAKYNTGGVYEGFDKYRDHTFGNVSDKIEFAVDGWILYTNEV